MLGIKDIHVGRDCRWNRISGMIRKNETTNQQNLYIQIGILSLDGNVRIWALPKSRRHRHMIKYVLHMACQLDNGESKKCLGSDLSIGK